MCDNLNTTLPYKKWESSLLETEIGGVVCIFSPVNNEIFPGLEDTNSFFVFQSKAKTNLHCNNNKKKKKTFLLLLLLLFLLL